jgi:hypothetical protein
MITKIKNIVNLKNAFNETEKPRQEINNPTQETSKPYYYGSIRNVSGVNDVSYLTRGGVYFLRDNMRDPKSSKHPRMIIQDLYLDKIGKIAVLEITSKPLSINVIPIVLRGRISYINPHIIQYYPVDMFFEETDSYFGMASERVLDIATNMFAYYFGIQTVKSSAEIIDAYMEYVEEFKARTKNYTLYTSYKPLENKEPLKLNISFEIDDRHDENCENTSDVAEDDDILVENDMPTHSDENDMDNVNISTEKKILIVDLNSQAILSAISSIESQPVGKIKLPQKITDMDEDQLVTFMAAIKINGYKMTSMMYNCAHSTISNKRKAIMDMYNVVYNK